MARLRSLGAWLAGAAGAFLLYWCVVVYALGDFNHQYGQDTWFALNLYLALITVGMGLVGGFLASLVLAPSVTLGAAVMSGIGFAVCQLVLVDVLARLYPDREMLVQGFAGALVIGAISMGFGKRHDPNR